jgi:type II secretory pathway pseudopilin PulG
LTAQIPVACRRSSQSGFTLVEAMMAIIILVFGLIAVTNLMVVAANSNTTASQLTASSALCAQQMDSLKAVPFDTLTTNCTSFAPCGDLLTDNTNCPSFTPSNATNPNCYSNQTVPGVGSFHMRWRVAPITGIANVYVVQLRCQAVSGLMASRTRTDLTAFRSCTDLGLSCPNP